MSYCEYSMLTRGLHPEYMAFYHDHTRKRMDKVLAYYWKREGKGGRGFERWRKKYLEYVAKKYPYINSKTNKTT